MESKYEHAKFIIERFDHYYDTVNNKGAFYIGVNTFIFSGVCAGYITLHDKMKSHIGDWEWFVLGLLLTCCIASTISTIMAIRPYSKDNHAHDGAASLMYFGGIAKHELNHFKEKFTALNDSAILNDAMQQMHSLAKGLNRKFYLLRWASYFLTAQYCIMPPILFFIFKNYQ